MRRGPGRECGFAPLGPDATIVSNDGIKAELDSIQAGEIDATISQPADLYAQYAAVYAKAAVDGRKFVPGPTDHGSTIVELPNGLLEDQLPAPLVTAENVDDLTSRADVILDGIDVTTKPPLRHKGHLHEHAVDRFR